MSQGCLSCARDGCTAARRSPLIGSRVAWDWHDFGCVRMLSRRACRKPFSLSDRHALYSVGGRRMHCTILVACPDADVRSCERYFHSTMYAYSWEDSPDKATFTGEFPVLAMRWSRDCPMWDGEGKATTPFTKGAGCSEPGD